MTRAGATSWSPPGLRREAGSRTCRACSRLGTNIWTVLANGTGTQRLLTAAHGERSARSVVVSGRTLDRLPGLLPRRRNRVHALGAGAGGGSPINISSLTAPFIETLRPQWRRRTRAAVRARYAARRRTVERRAGSSRRSQRTPSPERPVQLHQRRLGNEVPAGRRLRRAGRLPAARVAGRKRRHRDTQRDRPGTPSLPREPDLGRGATPRSSRRASLRCRRSTPPGRFACNARAPPRSPPTSARPAGCLSHPAQPLSIRRSSTSKPRASATASPTRKSRSPGTTSASTPARSPARASHGKTTRPTGKQ